MFLKKTEYSNIQLKDFFIGAVVNIYSRQLKIIDYAD
jgi:nucleoside-diphosphate kinase